jgi:hypothetical protein
MEKEGCGKCGKRDQCNTPCKAVNNILWKDNRVMERHFADCIVCYPQGKEVHFSEIKEQQIDNFSENDVIPWSSGDTKLKKTAVFIERFFNNVPCKVLAEKFGVKENTIVCIYAQAVEHIDRIIAALDARREGLKATKADRFTDDQKFFLLVSVFGFSGTEVARMFNQDHRRVSMKVKRLSDKYEALFSGQDISTIVEKEEIPIDDPPMPAKLTRADVVAMVDAYTEQGLSHRQAFKRIADRQGEVIGRPVKLRAVESRYYKAMAAAIPS